jgi:hypothetical protein
MVGVILFYGHMLQQTNEKKEFMKDILLPLQNTSTL